MNRGIGRLFAGLLVLTFVFMSYPRAGAYFDQGPVGVSVGKQTVHLEEGQTETISVTFSPSSSSQLPGCGMAECPQTCGEKDCLDKNGQCTCNGSTYQTYYAYASVASSNTSVATASYNSGTITVSAVAPGSATLTVTGSLRQFSSTTTTIRVSVTAAPVSESPAPSTQPSPVQPSPAVPSPSVPSPSAVPSAQPSVRPSTLPSAAPSTLPSAHPGASGAVVSPSISEKPGTATQEPAVSSSPGMSGTASRPGNTGTSGNAGTAGNAGTGVNAVRVAQNTAAGSETTAVPEPSEDAYTVLESDRGTIYFVPIQEGKMGGDILAKILGQKSYVNFQKKDDADNILYAWEFYGMELNEAADTVLTLQAGTEPFADAPEAENGEGLYVSFTEQGALPGTATLYLRVAEYFENEEDLHLYSYAGDGQVRQLEDVHVENGYVSAELESREDLILTQNPLEITADAEDTAAVSPKITADTSLLADLENAGESGGNPSVAVLATVIVVLLLAAAAEIVYTTWKRRRKDSEDA